MFYGVLTPKSNPVNSQIENLYGNKVRVRISGLCWQNEKLLLVNHRGLAEGDFWAPPGGGLEFGESVDACLRREFLEETGLQIHTGRFLFGCEFLRNPLHAIELFFEATAAAGALRTGDDPELPMIEEVQFMGPSQICALPSEARHAIFGRVPAPEELKTLNGFFRI